MADSPVSIQVSVSNVTDWNRVPYGAARRAASKAGTEALRGMRAESNRAIRATKAVKLSALKDKIGVATPTRKDILQWKIWARIEATPIIDFTGVKQKKRKGGGVEVEINKGSRVLLKSAFIATMRSGHKGVFVRTGEKTRAPVQGYRGHKKYAGRRKQPIKELYTTRVSDAFKDALPGTAARGEAVFRTAFARLLPLELAKG